MGVPCIQFPLCVLGYIVEQWLKNIKNIWRGRENRRIMSILASWGEIEVPGLLNIQLSSSSARNHGENISLWNKMDVSECTSTCM